MNPAFSVIFLTTLIGTGQGLFVAIYLTECLAYVGRIAVPDNNFALIGSAISVALMIGGLAASFFHLGHPERAWRTAAMWRTSWLSREVIVLPLTMVAVFAYLLLHYTNGNTVDKYSLLIGAIGVTACVLLFICTGMIYACIRFLQEWATPLTVINYGLLGCASGFCLAAVLASVKGLSVDAPLIEMALSLTLLAALSRGASLIRNSRLRPRSSPQSAIGVRHNRVVQTSQGFMGGSFNTREFFHGVSAKWFKSIKWIFLVLVFAAPAILLIVAMRTPSPSLLLVIFVAQYVGLLFERWYFFADSNHPQNLYYSAIG
jgi:sulfite dehydrogenase (quinone) subunit SoeC